MTEPLGKILVSACLLGELVRYDGKTNHLHHDLIREWQAQGRLVPICPEVTGGLSTPRAPAEIQFGTGADVLTGDARVINTADVDVTDAFLRGAEAALAKAKQSGCRFALMAAKSPSCGNVEIYDGHFISQLQPGQGVAAALLEAHGIQVFNQYQISELAEQLNEQTV